MVIQTTSFLSYGLEDDYGFVIVGGVLHDYHPRNYGDSGYIHVSIPDGVTRIGPNAISDSSYFSAASVSIPDSVTRIGEWAFRDCTGLTSIVVSHGVTDIDFNAFSNCENLTKAELPKSLTYLSYVAFEGCPKLKDIYYTGSKEEWEKIKPGGIFMPIPKESFPVSPSPCTGLKPDKKNDRRRLCAESVCYVFYYF